MSAFTLAARFNGAWNLRLAYLMGGYLLLDSFFIGTPQLLITCYLVLATYCVLRTIDY